MAVEQAVYIEWEVGDRLLDFVDGSRLGITAPGANTMAGSSRVMAPGESGLRTSVRGNRPHLNGVTRTAWYWTKTGKSYGPDWTKAGASRYRSQMSVTLAS